MQSRLLVVAPFFLAACSAAPSSTPTPSSTGAESAPNSTGAESASSPSTPAPEAAPVAPSATPTRARATLAPTRLDTCTPEGAGVANARPVATTVGHSLGGCVLRTPTVDPAAEPRALELNLLGGPSRAAEVVSCADGSAPSVDFATHSYATFQSSHYSSEHWQLAFAVDDGERVHVALMPVRVCQGVAPSSVVDLTAIDIASPGRSITVHRCNPPPLRCPAVP